MVQDRTYPPCMLVVNGREFILTDVNEKRVRDKLYKLYKPETLVEEWVDGECVNVNTLEYIFNYY